MIYKSHGNILIAVCIIEIFHSCLLVTCQYFIRQGFHLMILFLARIKMTGFASKGPRPFTSWETKHWNDRFEDSHQLQEQHQGTIFFSSWYGLHFGCYKKNFSLDMYIYIYINRNMNSFQIGCIFVVPYIFYCHMDTSIGFTFIDLSMKPRQQHTQI